MARTLKRSYLRTKAWAYRYDYIIDCVDKYYGNKLFNIMKVNPDFVPKTIDATYYMMTDKSSSIVRFNYDKDLFSAKVRDLWIMHALQFVRLNNKHVFVIVSDNLERAFDHDMPDNVLWCSNIRGTSDDDIRKLAVLQYIREDLGLKTGIYYIDPTSPLTEANSDILIVPRISKENMKFPYDWIPYHPNTWFDNTSYEHFKRDGAVLGVKIQMFNCFI